MTKTEWMDSIRSFEDLYVFCCDEDIELPNLYDEESKDEYFNERLYMMAENADTWVDLLRWLEDIPEGDEWYHLDEYEGDMYPADLDVYISDVADELDERGFFDRENNHPDSQYYDSSEQEEDFEIESEESLFAMITGNEAFVIKEEKHES